MQETNNNVIELPEAATIIGMLGSEQGILVVYAIFLEDDSGE